ncbi:TadE family protein [Thermotomaculum hydrothermale]|nr:TadE family protein [Thermotomaculum hydrothermale]
MTEFVMVIPVYLIMIFGVIFFVKAFFIKQQTISAARYVTIAKGEFKEKDEDIKENLGKIFFNRVDKDKVTFEKVNSSEALDTVFSGHGGDTNEVLGFFLKVLDKISSTKGYKVSYEIEVKGKFTQKIIGNKKKVTISTTYYIDKNTWSHKDVGSFLNFLWDLIKELGGAIGDLF